MDYWSILASAIAGGVGGLLGQVLVSFFSKKREVQLLGGLIGAIVCISIVKPNIGDVS